MAETDIVRTIRTILLVALIAGMIGISAELLLLGHTEGNWQKLPLVLLGLAALTLLVWFIIPRRATLRSFQLTMLTSIICGAIGIYHHYTGNEEFELEMYPDLHGWELLRETLTGATPVLAPAAISQIGLIGLAYAFRHPIGHESKRQSQSD